MIFFLFSTISRIIVNLLRYISPNNCTMMIFETFRIFKASNEIEAYTSTLSLHWLTHWLTCPHNALVSHLKLVPGYFNHKNLIFYLKKSNKQGWGAGKFFSGSWLFFQAAPAPDFFPKRLRLLFFLSSGSGSGSGSKEPKTPGSGSWLMVKFAKIFFSPQASKVKRQKNIKQVK